MPASVWLGAFFLLMGIGEVWAPLWMFRLAHLPARSTNAHPQRRWSPAESWLWLSAWIAMGLGMVLIGLTILRYGRGRYVAIPVHGPLFDQVISVLGVVFALGGFGLLFAWTAVNAAQDKRPHSQNSGDS